MDIFDDLVAEGDGLEAILAALGDEQWNAPSLAAGWSVADVILHLAQTDEAVRQSAAAGATSDWRSGSETVDGMMEARVRDERSDPAIVFARWKLARRTAVDTLRAADPDVKLRWAAAPLRPATIATTRIAEYWAHGLDVTEPLRIHFPDTDRLRHIAWLGHSTLPYAFGLAGLEPQPVRCELTGPNGGVWTFGPEDAESRIAGLAGEFCRVGAHRLAPTDTHLSVSGPHGATALRVLRNYAA